MNKFVKPLEGLRFLVETMDEHEINTSSQHEQLIHALGGITNQVLHENLTHFVCENINIKRILAARLLGITVVSPDWIFACRDANKRVEESEFSLTSELVELIASIDGNSADVVPVMSEPAAQLAQALRCLDSQYSVQNATQQSYHSQSHNFTNPTPFQHPSLNIPLPSFRERIPPRVLPGVFKRRRSDRIIDKQDSDSDEEYDISIRKIRDDLLKCPTSEKIDENEVMPVIYVNEPADSVVYDFESKIVEESVSDSERRLIREGSKRKETVSKSASSNSDTIKGGKSVKGCKQDPKKKSNAMVTSSSSISQVNCTSRNNKCASVTEDLPIIRTTRRGAVVASPIQREQQQSLSSNKQDIAKSVSSSNKAQYQESNQQIVATHQESSSSHQYQPPHPLILALSGFNKAEGEHEFIISTLKDLRDLISSSSISTSHAHSKRQKSKHTGTNIKANEPTVQIVEDDDDVAADFSYLIVPRNCTARTLRILFALARGRMIVSEEWVFSSLCAQMWVNPDEYIVPRFKKSIIPSSAKIEEKGGVFRGKYVSILDSTRPSVTVLTQLITVAGGKILLGLPTPLDSHGTCVVDEKGTQGKLAFCVVGDSEDLRKWVRLQRQQSQQKVQNTLKSSTTMLDHLNNLVAHGIQVVTCKFVFNCLEENQLRYALKKEGESLSALDIAAIDKAVCKELGIKLPKKSQKVTSTAPQLVAPLPVPPVSSLEIVRDPQTTTQHHLSPSVATKSINAISPQGEQQQEEDDLEHRLNDTAALTAAEFIDESQHDMVVPIDPVATYPTKTKHHPVELGRFTRRRAISNASVSSVSTAGGHVTDKPVNTLDAQEGVDPHDKQEAETFAEEQVMDIVGNDTDGEEVTAALGKRSRGESVTSISSHKKLQATSVSPPEEIVQETVDNAINNPINVASDAIMDYQPQPQPITTTTANIPTAVTTEISAPVAPSVQRNKRSTILSASQPDSLKDVAVKHALIKRQSLSNQNLQNSSSDNTTTINNNDMKPSPYRRSVTAANQLNISLTNSQVSSQSKLHSANRDANKETVDLIDSSDSESLKRFSKKRRLSKASKASNVPPTAILLDDNEDAYQALGKYLENVRTNKKPTAAAAVSNSSNASVSSVTATATKSSASKKPISSPVKPIIYPSPIPKRTKRPLAAPKQPVQDTLVDTESDSDSDESDSGSDTTVTHDDDEEERTWTLANPQVKEVKPPPALSRNNTQGTTDSVKTGDLSPILPPASALARRNGVMPHILDTSATSSSFIFSQPINGNGNNNNTNNNSTNHSKSMPISTANQTALDNNVEFQSNNKPSNPSPAPTFFSQVLTSLFGGSPFSSKKTHNSSAAHHPHNNNHNNGRQEITFDNNHENNTMVPNTQTAIDALSFMSSSKPPLSTTATSSRPTSGHLERTLLPEDDEIEDDDDEPVLSKVAKQHAGKPKILAISDDENDSRSKNASNNNNNNNNNLHHSHHAKRVIVSKALREKDAVDDYDALVSSPVESPITYGGRNPSRKRTLFGDTVNGYNHGAAGTSRHSNNCGREERDGPHRLSKKLF